MLQPLQTSHFWPCGIQLANVLSSLAEGLGLLVVDTCSSKPAAADFQNSSISSRLLTVLLSFLSLREFNYKRCSPFFSEVVFVLSRSRRKAPSAVGCEWKLICSPTLPVSKCGLLESHRGFLFVLQALRCRWGQVRGKWLLKDRCWAWNRGVVTKWCCVRGLCWQGEVWGWRCRLTSFFHWEIWTKQVLKHEWEYII